MAKDIYKIAVPLMGDTANDLISNSFGRCSFLLIYEQETSNEKTLPNPYSSELGAGILLARMLIENNAGAVITKQIGANPFRLLKAANVKVYQCSEGTGLEAIKLYNNGKLNYLEIIDEGLPFERRRRRCRRKILTYKNNLNKKRKI